MPIEWVTGAAILAHAGIAAPSADETRLGGRCAREAITAGINARLADAPLTGDTPELSWSALTAGVEAYKRREAIFGVTGYVDLQGAAIRVARDYLEAVAPIIARYATLGLA